MKNEEIHPRKSFLGGFVRFLFFPLCFALTSRGFNGKFLTYTEGVIRVQGYTKVNSCYILSIEICINPICEKPNQPKGSWRSEQKPTTACSACWCFVLVSLGFPEGLKMYLRTELVMRRNGIGRQAIEEPRKINGRGHLK